MNKPKSWICDVKEKDGEFYIELTDEMLEGSDFKIGDELDWNDNKDGSFTLTKKKINNVWVMVETVSMFRQRYVVQTPANHPEYALDDVVMETAKEFSQEWIGEQIISHRVVSEKEALIQCDKDNDYASSWSDDHKLSAFFTKEGERRDV
jgi:hypothetical protein